MASATFHTGDGASFHAMNHLTNPDYILHRAAAVIQPAVVKNCAWYVEQYEAIERKSAQEKGAVLAAFKLSGAWREKYTRWNDACEDLLGISKGHADKLILKFREVTLAHSDPVVQKAEEKALVQVEKAREEPAPVSISSTSDEEAKMNMVVDELGFPVPESLLAAHAKRDDITKLMTAASTLKCFFDTQQEKPDPQFKGAFDGQIQTLMKTEGQIHFGLSQCRPDVVCPSCDGKAKGCQDCRSTGFISSHDWQRKFVKSSASWIQAKVTKRQKAIEAL